MAYDENNPNHFKTSHKNSDQAAWVEDTLGSIIRIYSFRDSETYTFVNIAELDDLITILQYIQKGREADASEV